MRVDEGREKEILQRTALVCNMEEAKIQKILEIFMLNAVHDIALQSLSGETGVFQFTLPYMGTIKFKYKNGTVKTKLTRINSALIEELTRAIEKGESSLLKRIEKVNGEKLLERYEELY